MERIEGDKSVWSPIKLRRLKTFNANAKTLSTTVQNKVVSLKEDKSLFQRFLVVSQKRKETDLPFVVGNYELTVSPKSLFSADGNPLPCLDKSQIMHEIEKLIDLSDNSRVESGVQKVIIIDGMALVNKINKGKSMKTCKDFAEMFTKQLHKESEPYKEVRLIFDRYLENSLKNRTRQKRISGVNVRYIIGDNTNMEAMTMKRFLSHIQTKHALTVYLAKFAKESFRAIDKKCYCVRYKM